MRRTFGMRLTDETMIEISKVKERLRAYKDSVQMYPALLEEQPEEQPEELPDGDYTIHHIHHHHHVNRDSKPQKSNYKGLVVNG